MTICCFDFESEAIENRPKYPPKPVGLAILIDGETPYYMAWGHPIENNCTLEYATNKLQGLFVNEDFEFVAHNLPFDAAIVEEKLGLKFPWERSGDTMLLAFLSDPFGELSLKPLAEKLLGEPPTEQEAVRDWLVRHGVCRANDKAWGAYISKAPGNLVGTYAIGDVERTMKLYKYYKELMA
jgi:3'-5' exonuclease